MSIRNINQNTLASKTLPGTTFLYGKWVRNPSWLPLASISSSDQKFTGLYRINRYSNFVALSFTTSGGAQYTVDWGDGSAPVNVNSATQANYEYDWTDVDLNGTDAPVTFQDSGDTVTRNNHGYLDGMNISFAEIVTTTGIVATQTYYVVNATTNTFQLANTVGGSPIALTNDGTGTILPYKQVVVTVTPVSGNFTAASLILRHNQAGLNTYNTGWLDVAFAGNYTTLAIGNATQVSMSNLQQVNILSSAITSYASLFSFCYNLQNVVGINTSGVVTAANSMFNSCVNLETIPIFPFANVVAANSMFNSCNSFNSVPLLDTRNVSNVSSMFLDCFNLREIPPLNTSNVTNMANLFSNCVSLESSPLLNTSNVTNTASMFNNCRGLKNIALIDTSKVTDMSRMFGNCNALLNVPLLNTSNVTNMSFAFSNCFNLNNLPMFDTTKVANLESTFANCWSLTSVPNFNLGNVTTMRYTFSDCVSLESVPAFNTANNANLVGTFFNCYNLKDVGLMNTSNVTNMDSAFYYCRSLTNLPLFDTGKVTNMSYMVDSCRNLQSFPLWNTQNVASWSFFYNNSDMAVAEIPAWDWRKAGGIFTLSPNITRVKAYGLGVNFAPTLGTLSNVALNEIYTNLGRVGNVGTANNSVTFQGTADTVTKVGHGFANLDAVRFSTITTTTGISINTPYYAINVTANTFQLTSTLTGSAINLVNDGTGLIANATITVTGNYGTATDNPAIATAKGWVVTGS